MNALVPVFTGAIAGQYSQLCNARDLHAVLNVGKDFSNWIKTRLAEYGFIEGEDFSPNLAKTSPKGGRPRTDYYLTLDTAKELAMIENNEKGRQVRRYFIECEKNATAPAKAIKPAPRLPKIIYPTITLTEIEASNLYSLLKMVSWMLSREKLEPIEKALGQLKSPLSAFVYDLHSEFAFNGCLLKDLKTRCQKVYDLMRTDHSPAEEDWRR